MLSKNTIAVAFASLVILSSCTAGPDKVDVVDKSNPAAVFCVSSNGVFEVREDPEGNQYSVCVLEEGEIDAWELYRREAPDTQSE